MTAAGVSSSNRESLIASPSPLATRDPSLRSRAGSLLATRMSVVIVVAFGAEQLEPEARLGRTDVTSLAGRGVQGGGGKLGERERFPLKRDVDLPRFQIPAAGPTALNPPAGPGELALILGENACASRGFDVKRLDVVAGTERAAASAGRPGDAAPRAAEQAVSPSPSRQQLDQAGPGPTNRAVSVHPVGRPYNSH